MFSTYDLKSFSKRLKEIRKSCGYTQENVVSGTGLSTETLRKLENGLVIPRYDTIEILSLFYKTDLQSVLNNYKSSKEIIKYYEVIDTCLTGNDQSALINAIEGFEEFAKTADVNLIERKELKQLELFLKGLKLSYSDYHNPDIQKQAIEIYIEALHSLNPAFKYEFWREFKYNYLELRILFAIAGLEGYLRNCIQSNDLLEYILNTLDMSIYSKHNDKLLATKAISLLSYNYHRIDDHKKALEFAEQGIEFCRKFFIMSDLPMILVRKGVAMFFLQLANYEPYFDQAITLLLVQGHDEYAEFYKQSVMRYRKTNA